jgi:hypothetical protein
LGSAQSLNESPNYASALARSHHRHYDEADFDPPPAILSSVVVVCMSHSIVHPPTHSHSHS